MKLYDAVSRFHQAGAGATVDYHNPAAWSSVSMRLTTYPNTESKILGNMLRWNNTVPALFTWVMRTY